MAGRRQFKDSNSWTGLKEQIWFGKWTEVDVSFCEIEYRLMYSESQQGNKLLLRVMILQKMDW